MTKKVKNRTKKSLTSVAAILALTGFMTIVTTASACERVQIQKPKVSNKAKLAGGVVSLITAASLFTIRETKLR